MINPRADRARYQQLADILRGHILSGEWTSGRSLPSVDGLVRQYRVTRAVAEGAIRVLKQEGLIETSQGRPARVREIPPLETLIIEEGWSWITRMPTHDEAILLELPDLTPIAVVYTGEDEPRLYRGDRYVFQPAPSSGLRVREHGESGSR